MVSSSDTHSLRYLDHGTSLSSKTISHVTGVSIIITTHYIEEARDAHMVGIMRNGRLLAQEPPGLLMERHQAQTLEKVFLRLCIETE